MKYTPKWERTTSSVSHSKREERTRPAGSLPTKTPANNLVSECVVNGQRDKKKKYTPSPTSFPSPSPKGITTDCKKPKDNVVVMWLRCYVHCVRVRVCACVRFQQGQMGGDGPRTRGRGEVDCIRFWSIREEPRTSATTGVDF